mgnify:CR=1 FL=1
MAAAYRDRENYTVTSFDGYVTTSDGNIKLWNSNKGYTWLTKNGWSFILDTEVANARRMQKRWHILNLSLIQVSRQFAIAPVEGALDARI